MEQITFLTFKSVELQLIFIYFVSFYNIMRHNIDIVISHTYTLVYSFIYDSLCIIRTGCIFYNVHLFLICTMFSLKTNEVQREIVVFRFIKYTLNFGFEFHREPIEMILFWYSSCIYLWLMMNHSNASISKLFELPHL